MELPLLVGQPRLIPALNVGQVGHHQLLAGRGDDAATNGRASQLHDVVGGQVRAPGQHGLDARVDGVLPERWPGQVLGLEEPPSPTPGTRRAVELQEPTQTLVRAGAARQHPVLGRAGGAGLQAHAQQFLERRVNVHGQRLLHCGHLQVGHVHCVILKYVQAQCCPLRGIGNLAIGHR